LVIAAILGFFGQASNKCIVVDPPKKKGGFAVALSLNPENARITS
jgi:hypothetical protein